MRLNLLLTLTGLLLANCAHAGDTIERSCQANYALHVGSLRAPDSTVDLINHNDFISARRLDHPGDPLAFSARRGCGATVPNRCRERASAAAMACMVEHGRHPGSRPAACGRDGVRDYRIDDLAAQVRERACAWAADNQHFSEKVLPKPYVVMVNVVGFVHGDSGCSAEAQVYEAQVLCPLAP